MNCTFAVVDIVTCLPSHPWSFVWRFCCAFGRIKKIEFFFAPGWTCPETCLSRSLWNFECAGCGLTRSFIHLASGDLKASIGIHRVGWLLALATAIQIPYRIFMLRWLRARGLPEPVPRMLNWLVAAVLIAALLVNWLLKLIGI